MQIIIIIIFIMLCGNLHAQNKDTSICEKSYFILARFENGKAKELGETKEPVKNGSWIYLDETGIIAKTGHFKNNLKDGWWRNGTSGNFTIYRSGKVIGHGKGCWCCPDF